MIDETLSDRPGVELDAEMAQRIIDDGDDYSQRIADLARFLSKNKAAFRARLKQLDLIQDCDPSVQGFELAAVDGGSAVDPRGSGALIAASAYKATLNDDKQRGDTRTISVPNDIDAEIMATLLRIHLELSLLAPDKLDTDMLVVLDHSFWGVLQQVSRALAAYKRRRALVVDRGQDPRSDALLRAWQDLFRSCLSLDGSFLGMIRNKQVISLSKTGLSQYFVGLLLPSVGKEAADSEEELSLRLTLATSFNDRALLRHVLQPGEYTTPQPVYDTVRESGAVKSWRRSRFATAFDPARDGPDPFEARHQVLDEYGVPRDSGEEPLGRRLFVTYYWPHSWSRVYRIEFHEALLANKDSPPDMSGRGARFQRVLASVRRSLTPEAKEPIAQVLADERAKAATASAVALLPERAFYQLRDKYRDDPDVLDVVDTLLSEERT